MKEELFSPPAHRLFKVKRLGKQVDPVIHDCEIAYIEPTGGGPEPDHAHEHDHLIVVISGTATLRMAGKERMLGANESIRVPGGIPHSIWNTSDSPVKVLGLSVRT